MIFIHVGSVVMLATGETTTTWMLSVLSYTTVTGGHMAAAKIKMSAWLFQRFFCLDTTNAGDSEISVGFENPRTDRMIPSCSIVLLCAIVEGESLIVESSGSQLGRSHSWCRARKCNWRDSLFSRLRQSRRHVDGVETEVVVM